MAIKYKIVRMPLTAFNNFKLKQEKMKTVVAKITGKKLKVPLTKVFCIASENEIYIDDKNLIRRIRKK